MSKMKLTVEINELLDRISQGAYNYQSIQRVKEDPMTSGINSTTNNWNVIQLNKSQNSISSSLQKISTGKKINSAADGASALTIIDRLISQEQGLGQAMRNASDAISMNQIAEGALSEATSILQDIRVKSIQAANGSHTTESRRAIQSDIDKSVQSLDLISQTTSFNGQKLLSGGFTDKNFQVGAIEGETISLSIQSAEPSKLGSSTEGTVSDINVLTEEGAQTAIGIADAALASISSERANVGSTQNQLESTINNLATTRVNIASAISTMGDLDYAEESMNLSKMEALSKARTFADAQAKTINKSNIMTLLQG